MDIDEMNQMYGNLGIRQEVREFAAETEQTLKERFESTDAVVEYNQMKIIKGTQGNRVNGIHLAATTDYGYNDLERDTLEGVYASIFRGESALVRPQLTSGIHVLHVTLSGNLRPGDGLLSPVGKSHGILEEVTGIRDSVGSLKEYGVSCRQVELLKNGSFDYEGITVVSDEKTKLVTIQRSKGYAARPILSVKWIGELISFIKDIKPDVVCMVDNCCGESMETTGPTDAGANTIVGSLIKNSGGGLVSIDGYIMGRKDYMERASYRLNAPGLGKEIGTNLGLNQQLRQGLFLSLVVVSGALGGVIFAASIYERLSCAVMPSGSKSYHGAIQATASGVPEGVVSFCKKAQAAVSADSYVTPEPWDMPGYGNPVTTTAGASVQSFSIELSVDGPIKPPYVMYFQGGLTWYHVKLGILKSLQQLSDDGVLKILR